MAAIYASMSDYSFTNHTQSSQTPQNQIHAGFPMKDVADSMANTFFINQTQYWQTPQY